MKPWRYRPSEDQLDWEDNWLSNSLAWASQKITPSWCADEKHWSVRLTNPLWAECPCCLSFRWLLVGGILGLLVGLLF